MPNNFKDMVPDEIAFSGPLKNEKIDYDEKFEYDDYNFEETDINDPDFSYLDRDYYKILINSKDVYTLTNVFMEVQKRVDISLRKYINEFINLMRNMKKDHNGNVINHEAKKTYDELNRIFLDNWEEIQRCFDEINEEYGLEKPKSY